MKQALHRNGYPGLLLVRADMPRPDQPAEEGVEENHPAPAPDQPGPSTHIKTTAVELLDLNKTKKKYIVVIP